MATGKMHADEVEIDAALVRRLLAEQFPQWADRAITPVLSAGTDNALYRLGSDLVVRLPRIQSATGQVDKEGFWLPRLAPHLPLAIPVPLAKGVAGEDYPWQWSVYQWLAGENATTQRISDLDQAARDLARFIVSLQHLDPTGGPLRGAHNSFRGEPLSLRDDETRAAIALLDGLLDTAAVTAAWEAALRVPAWDGPLVWLHGDLHPLNPLVFQGRLRAVIDFGCLGIGDPACAGRCSQRNTFSISLGGCLSILRNELPEQFMPRGQTRPTSTFLFRLAG